MKILYFYQYYSTPKGSWGTRIHEFAKHWVDQGHEVTVVTSIYYKSDLQATKLIEDQMYEGVKVKVLNVKINNKDGVLKRIWSFILYSLLSSWFALTLKADVVVASSGPITVGLPGLVARYLRGRKLVFEVRDLWPHFPVQVGVLTNSTMIKLSYWFEKICYKASSLIVVLSPGAADDIEERLGYTHSISVPNIADNQLFGTKNNAWKLPDWAENKKIAIYTGNIGSTNNSELLLNAAAILQEQGRDDVMIILIGDGQQREALEAKALKLGLNNFKILGLMPKTELVNWVQSIMVSVIPLTDIPVIGHSSPNKLFDSLAAGKPIIQTTNGWIKTLLEENKCGYTVPTDQPQELVQKLIHLADHPELVESMGKNANQIAVNEFDKLILAQKMLDGIVDVHNTKKKSRV